MLKMPEIGDKIKVIQAESGALGANGLTGVVTKERSSNGLSYGIKVKMASGDVWAIGHFSNVKLKLIKASKSGEPSVSGAKAVRQELETLDIQQLFDRIVEQENHDDWRDLFQHIHNWGYNTDFTYNDITNPKEHSLKDYLVEYLMEDIDEDEEGEEDDN